VIEPYSVFLHLDATEALRTLRRSECDRVTRFAHSLTRDPFQPGDFQEHDEWNRANEVRIVGRVAVVYYVDHADREVRILEVRQAVS
jgi:mRNA-degrading endonuclease RelE of RelBE toxin-antitoxin system